MLGPPIFNNVFGMLDDARGAPTLEQVLDGLKVGQ
jgi:hypothetical protein